MGKAGEVYIGTGSSISLAAKELVSKLDIAIFAVEHS